MRSTSEARGKGFQVWCFECMVFHLVVRRHQWKRVNRLVPYLWRPAFELAYRIINDEKKESKMEFRIRLEIITSPFFLLVIEISN